MAASSEEFKKALNALEEAVLFANQNQTNQIAYKIARDACIQRFEFCVELSWKVSAKFLGSSAFSAKVVIREMAQAGLINNPEIWFEFIEARNRSSHTYNEDQAILVFNVIPQFLIEAQMLIAKLQK